MRKKIWYDKLDEEVIVSYEIPEWIEHETEAVFEIYHQLQKSVKLSLGKFQLYVNEQYEIVIEHELFTTSFTVRNSMQFYSVFTKFFKFMKGV